MFNALQLSLRLIRSRIRLCFLLATGRLGSHLGQQNPRGTFCWFWHGWLPAQSNERGATGSYAMTGAVLQPTARNYLQSLSSLKWTFGFPCLTPASQHPQQKESGKDCWCSELLGHRTCSFIPVSLNPTFPWIQCACASLFLWCHILTLITQVQFSWRQPSLRKPQQHFELAPNYSNCLSMAWFSLLLLIFSP